MLCCSIHPLFRFDRDDVSEVRPRIQITWNINLMPGSPIMAKSGEFIYRSTPMPIHVGTAAQKASAKRTIEERTMYIMLRAAIAAVSIANIGPACRRGHGRRRPGLPRSLAWLPKPGRRIRR